MTELSNRNWASEFCSSGGLEQASCGCVRVVCEVVRHIHCQEGGFLPPLAPMKQRDVTTLPKKHTFSACSLKTAKVGLIYVKNPLTSSGTTFLGFSELILMSALLNSSSSCFLRQYLTITLRTPKNSAPRMITPSSNEGKHQYLTITLSTLKSSTPRVIVPMTMKANIFNGAL